mmetsp:Transcript_39793/g.94513  ORF Transcript_39793/g.94513 Transcript_39793/m.94513 type:complete len:314 (-) Transcript_39793:237-1178(-)
MVLLGVEEVLLLHVVLGGRQLAADGREDDGGEHGEVPILLVPVPVLVLAGEQVVELVKGLWELEPAPVGIPHLPDELLPEGVVAQDPLSYLFLLAVWEHLPVLGPPEGCLLFQSGLGLLLAPFPCIGRRGLFPGRALRRFAAAGVVQRRVEAAAELPLVKVIYRPEVVRDAADGGDCLVADGAAAVLRLPSKAVALPGVGILCLLLFEGLQLLGVQDTQVLLVLGGFRGLLPALWRRRGSLLLLAPRRQGLTLALGRRGSRLVRPRRDADRLLPALLRAVLLAPLQREWRLFVLPVGALASGGAPRADVALHE